MATINPFYRFEDAVEVAGISQGAVDISEALNQMLGEINFSYAGGTISDTIFYLNQTIDGYNALYRTQFILETPQYPPFFLGFYNVQMYIYDPRLIVLYPLHRISIVLFVNGAGVITNNNAWFLGVIHDDYNYSAALFDGEKAAYSALLNQYETGAARFPKYYKYNAATGVAESSIARFKNCKYDEEHSAALRFPLDTLPRANKPVIRFGQLDADAKYVVSLYENIIAYSMGAGVSFLDIRARLIDLILPNGYEYDFYESYSGSNRIQYNIFKTGGGQGFSLILRESSGFLFQRFYAPSFSTYNILADNGSGVTLPYPPDNFSKRYGGVFYDFEFCEFDNCSYPPAESYPMPIKSGDSYNFNIIDSLSNTLNESGVDIGIFDEEYNFIQKIGFATRPTTTCETTCEHEFVYVLGSENVASYLQDINDAIPASMFEPISVVRWAIQSDEPLTTILGEIVLTHLTPTLTMTNIISIVEPFGITVTEQDGSYSFSYTSTNLPCAKNYTFKNFIIGGVTQALFETEAYLCVCGTLDGQQLQASVIIPPKKEGCYRFGLYKFGYSFEGLQSIWSPKPITQGTNSIIAITNLSNQVLFGVAIPTALDSWNDLIYWIKNNVPFMKVEIDTSNYLSITIYPYIDLTNHKIQIGQYIFSGNTIIPLLLDESSSIGPLYDENINELYSFSNLLDLNNSDCFSTIVQYWNDSKTIGEGFEYFNNWFQQIRLGINGGGKKPVLTESVYRQSNGVHRRPQNKQDLSIDLHTDFIDFETQSALVDATRHQNFVVDGQNLFVNGDIDVGTIQDFTTQSSFEDLAQVKFSALIQGYQPKNSSCLNC